MQTHAHAIRAKLSILLQGFPDYPTGWYCDPLASRHDVAELLWAIDSLHDDMSGSGRDRRLEAYSRDVAELVRRLADALSPRGCESLADILPALVACTATLIGYIDPQTQPKKQGPDAPETEAGPALTSSERLTLCTMANFDVLDLATAQRIAEAMDPAEALSDRTITPAIRKLIELGLAERPEGDRQGARLTLRGRRLAQKIKIAD